MYIVGKTMEGRFVPEQTEIKKSNSTCDSNL
jgi:hypothetical protein